MLTTGLSPSLKVSDTRTRAEQQDIYFGAMCLRGGLTSLAANGDNLRCPGSLSPHDWGTVVLAALNDIDDRCEAYLVSLDRAKRDRDAFVAQLKATKTTTSAILTAATLAPGSKALLVVGAAFGFAERSLDHYYSRLILEVEGSSIQQLVLRRQLAYRTLLTEKYLAAVKNHQGAYYAVRGYVRICLPESIEGVIAAGINDLTYRSDEKLAMDGSRRAPRLTNLPKGFLRKSDGDRRREEQSSVVTNDDPDLESLGALR